MNFVRKNSPTRCDDENEEIEIYKERLREMEVAFRYNLSLISDRDAELDVLEEQLRNGIAELEKVSREKAEYEERVARLNDESTKKLKLLKDELSAKEKMIAELERKNDGNLKTLMRTLEDMRKEQGEEITKLAARYEKQRIGLEKNFVRFIQLKEIKHSEELNELNRKYMLLTDEMTKEKQRVDAIKAEKKNMRKQIIKMKKDSEERECSYLDQISQLNYLYNRVSEELEGMVENVETKSKKIMVGSKVNNAATQTVLKEQGEKDRQEFLMMQEQNNVLKGIIKNLKRNKVKQESASARCPECVRVQDKIDEVNKKFECEIAELRKALEIEKTQRFEEESIIDNLEASIVCLKEKLLAGLRQKLENIPDGDVKGYACDKEIRNEFHAPINEKGLNEKMEGFLAVLEQEKRAFDDTLKEIRGDYEARLFGKMPERELIGEMQKDLKNLKMKIGGLQKLPKQCIREAECPELQITKKALNTRREFRSVRSDSDSRVCNNFALNRMSANESNAYTG